MFRPSPADLASLSELARAFARAYPSLAPHLSEPSRDPDVERLLDAFSSLTEHVHRLVDEGAPRAAQVFADLLAPELTRPFPASTIVAFDPPREGGRVQVQAGAEVESVPVDGTPCRFTAWSAFDVVPWALARARTAWNRDEGQTLSLSLEATSVAPEGLVASLLPLRLHLSRDTHAGRTLLLFLRCHLSAVELRIGGEGGRCIALGGTVRPWGLLSHEALLPPEAYEHPGLRLLREYLVMPAKLAFVEVPAPRGEASPEDARRVELVFRFDTELPSGFSLAPDDVRLNCVPVTNVFETTTDPVTPTLERPRQVLRTAGLPLGHGETYSVTRVMARLAAVSGMVQIAPFSDFEAAPPDALEDVFFVAEAATELQGGGATVLSLGSPAAAPPVPDVAFLSVDTRASNGALPNVLRVGDVARARSGAPLGLAARNVAPVVPYAAPPRGDELRARALAMTTLSALPVTEPRALRTLLRALDLRPQHDPQAARVEAQRLAAIVDVRVTPGRARGAVAFEPVARGGGAPAALASDAREAVVLGHDVHVVLRTAGFGGEADAVTFGAVLAHFFAHEATLGSFVRTTVTLQETGRVVVFPALHGDTSFPPTNERPR